MFNWIAEEFITILAKILYHSGVSDDADLNEDDGWFWNEWS